MTPPVRTPPADFVGLSDLSLREVAHAGTGPGRSMMRRACAAVAILATLAALATAARHNVVRASGAPLLVQFFDAAVHPRVDGQFLALTAKAAVTTLAYAVLGTGLSLVIGAAGGVLTSETWWRQGARRRHLRIALGNWAVSRAVLAIPRGIHELVWGLFLLSVLGIQPLVPVLAIGIAYGAVTAKVFSELLDETAREPYTALVALGVGRLAAILYGLLPPALPDLMSYAFYRFECAIRSATVLGLVGAGGLGFQLSLSFQALRYNEIWTLLYALIALCAAADFWSAAVRRRRAVPLRAHVRPSHDRVRTGSILAVLALIPFSVWWVGLSPAAVWAAQTWDLVGRLFTQAWPPSLGGEGALGLLKLSAVTLAMSVLAIALAFIGGIFLAFPAASRARQDAQGRLGKARRAKRMLVYLTARALLIVLRAIPPPVWALVFLLVLYPGVLPAALALGVYTLGVLGRLMAEAAENLDQRPLRALRAHGASRQQVFWYGVIPSAAPRFIAFSLYRWEVTIRETVVVGVVGAGGLGLLLNQQLASFAYGGALATLLAVIVLTLLVDFTSAVARRALH